jgi:hypothetical protein
MKSNPYEFSNVDDPTQNTAVLAGDTCPEFPLKIRITGDLSELEALRIAARCKAIRPGNPKSGKPVKPLNGLLLLAVVMFCFVGRKLVVDIRTVNYAFENLLYWITCIVVPAVSIMAVVVIFRRHRFRVESADPPIWGKTQIELDAKSYSAARHSLDGKLCTTWYRWPLTKILASNEAWLLNSQEVNPVLIPRNWLTLDQQREMDQFVDDLSQWQFSPAAKSTLANLPPVLPPLPADGIPFNIGSEQHAEFGRLFPQINVLFPEMPRERQFMKPWFWKCWGVGLFLCSICSPAYVLLTREGSIHVTFLLTGMVGWFIFQIGNARSAAPDICGVITDSTVWIETRFMRSSIPLQDFGQYRIAGDTLLLSTERSKAPFVLVRSSFSTEAEWQSARQRIEAVVVL